MIIAALWLLLSASDPFGFIDPQWQSGLRGLPNASLAQIDGDSCLVLRATNTQPTPYFDDYVRQFPRPVLNSERPFCVAHIWLPPFNEWPTTPNYNGNYIYCGFRVTETRTQQGALLYPGIFLGRDGTNNPVLYTRILAGFDGPRGLLVSGWWTVGIGWSAEGVISFYAAPGKVELTETDKFATDTALFPVLMKSVNGWFLDCSVEQGATVSSPWYFGDVQLFADIPPTLSIDRNTEESLEAENALKGGDATMTFEIDYGPKESKTSPADVQPEGGALTLWEIASLAVSLSASGYPTEPYQLQRSTDLATWETLTTLTSGDSVVEPIATDRAFYRLSQ